MNAMNAATAPNTPKKKFFQLDEWVIDLLGSNALTKIEHRLFWYFFKLERFGDRFVNLPSQSAIAKSLDITRKSVNQAQAKLHRLGLFDFKVDNWQMQNLCAPSSPERENGVLIEFPDVSNSSKTLGEESYRVSKKCYTLSNSGDSLGEESYTPYIDRARDQTITDFNSDLIQKKANSACDGNLEKEPLNASSSPEQKLGIESSQRTEFLAENKSSEIFVTEGKYSSCQNFEDRFRQRTELLPFEEWANGRKGRKQFKADFIEAWRQYLSGTSYYCKELRRQATTGDAKASVILTSRTSEGTDLLMARWESFEETKQKAQAQPIMAGEYEGAVDELRVGFKKRILAGLV